MTDEVIYAGPIEVEDVSVGNVDVEEINATPETLILFSLVDKLNSIAWGARNDQPVAVKLWDTTEVSSSAPGSSGDAIPYVGTTTLQEIGRGLLIEHSFRGSGWIFIHVVASFSDSTSGSMRAVFSLETAPDYQAGIDDDPLTRGLPPTWTVNQTFETQDLLVDTDTGYLMFGVAIHAGGHTSATWDQYYDGHFQHTAFPRASPPADLNTPLADKVAVSIDPTVRNLIRLQFKAATLGGTQALNVISSRATFFHPRDHSGY